MAGGAQGAGAPQGYANGGPTQSSFSLGASPFMGGPDSGSMYAPADMGYDNSGGDDGIGGQPAQIGSPMRSFAVGGFTNQMAQQPAPAGGGFSNQMAQQPAPAGGGWGGGSTGTYGAVNAPSGVSSTAPGVSGSFSGAPGVSGSFSGAPGVSGGFAGTGGFSNQMAPQPMAKPMPAPGGQFSNMMAQQPAPGGQVTSMPAGGPSNQLTAMPMAKPMGGPSNQLTQMPMGGALGPMPAPGGYMGTMGGQFSNMMAQQPMNNAVSAYNAPAGGVSGFTSQPAPGGQFSNMMAQQPAPGGQFSNMMAQQPAPGGQFNQPMAQQPAPMQGGLSNLMAQMPTGIGNRPPMLSDFRQPTGRQVRGNPTSRHVGRNRFMSPLARG